MLEAVVGRPGPYVVRGPELLDVAETLEVFGVYYCADLGRKRDVVMDGVFESPGGAHGGRRVAFVVHVSHVAGWMQRGDRSKVTMCLIGKDGANVEGVGGKNKLGGAGTVTGRRGETRRAPWENLAYMGTFGSSIGVPVFSQASKVGSSLILQPPKRMFLRESQARLSENDAAPI